jgi:acyl-CoA thioester hydrolase
MLREHEIEIRVRYQEADAMGFLHHATYFVYFEMGRVELNRASGGDYRQMEAQGQFAVVVKAECRYRRPARFDDVLRLRTSVTRVTDVKIEYQFDLFRGDEQLAVGHTTLAIVDRDGRVQKVPEVFGRTEPGA